MSDQQFLTNTEVAKRYGVNSVTLWRWRKEDPSFPAARMIGPHPRWSIEDLVEWENSRQEVK